MEKSKEDVTPIVTEDREVGLNDYVKTITLDSNGRASHLTDEIKGRLHHIIFRTTHEGELAITVNPVNFSEWKILNVKSLKKFAVYSTKILSVDYTGEPIQSPPEYSDVVLNGQLSIEISNGQEGTEIEVVIRYG